MILLDTSILSRVLRRAADDLGAAARRAFRQAMDSPEDVEIPGIVLQEILSGLSTDTVVARIRSALQALPVALADVADHEVAARVSNTCRRSGTTVRPIDALIAAQAINRKARLLTADGDFQRIASCVELRLLVPR